MRSRPSFWVNIPFGDSTIFSAAETLFHQRGVIHIIMGEKNEPFSQRVPEDLSRSDFFKYRPREASKM